MPDKALQMRAKRLAGRFYCDAQALFDHRDMDGETNDTPVFQALLNAQSWVEEVTEAEVE